MIRVMLLLHMGTNSNCYDKFWKKKTDFEQLCSFSARKSQFRRIPLRYPRWEWSAFSSRYSRHLVRNLPRKFDFDEKCSFSMLKTLLPRILNRKCSESCFIQHNLAHLSKILERKIDLVKLCCFSPRKSQFRRILFRYSRFQAELLFENKEIYVIYYILYIIYIYFIYIICLYIIYTIVLNIRSTYHIKI